MRVRNVGPDDIDLWHVEMNRHMILGERWIHNSAGTLVEQRFLGECEAEPHDDAATKLARGHLGTNDVASVERSDPARYAGLAGHLVDAYFAKLRAVGMF